MHISKIWLINHKKKGSGKSIKSEENKISLEGILPFLYTSQSVILRYIEFSGIENVRKNVYPKKENMSLF